MSVEQVCDAGPGEEVLASLCRMFADRCRADARWLAALHEAGRAVAGRRERLRVLDEFSGDEVAAALGWSLSMAGRLLALADDLLGRLPEVHAAMAAGVLELGKATVFSEWTRELEPDHAHHACAVVLPEASRLSVYELTERIQAVAAALDPEWARRRLEAAKRGATVFGAMNPSGTASIVGRDLDPVAAVAAMARIDTLAEQLRSALRARDVHHPIGWLRAKVYERLLDGSAAGEDDDTLLDALIAALTPPDGDDPGPEDTGPDGVGPDDTGPGDAGPDGPGPGDTGPGDSGPNGPVPDGPGPDETGSDVPAPDDTGPDTDPDGPSPDDSDGSGPGPSDGDGGDDDDPSSDEPGDEVDRPAPEIRRATRTGTVAVRLRLTTALGLDDVPAEVPTWGTVTAEVARTLVDQRHAGEWRLVLTDAEGHLEHLFLLRRRPTGAGSRRRPRRRAGRRTAHDRAIVELQIPTHALADLHPDDHAAWAAILREAHARAAGLPALGSDDHPATTRGDAARRRAGAELDRWTRTRDRCCVGVMCTRQADTADLDHTRDWAIGGITVAENLGALCRHTHRLKHVGGWRLEQPVAGHFRWTSRAGLTHEIRPRPVTPALPAPRPRRDGRARVPVEEATAPEHRADDLDDTPIWLTLESPAQRGAAARAQVRTARVGEPQTGDPRAAEPQIGDPQAGEPQLGEPEIGEPRAAEAAARYPDEPPF